MMKKYELLDKVYKSDLPSRAKQVMFYLINRANVEGTCFPSIRTIASDCGVSERTIQRTMLILLDAGFVKKDSRFREKGGQTSNLYTLESPLETNTHDKKEPREEIVVDIEEKMEKSEEIDTIDFQHYKSNIEVLDITVDRNPCEESIGILNDIEEVINKGGICLMTAKYHPIFMQPYSAVDMRNYKDPLVKIQCHGEGDNLYPP